MADTCGNPLGCDDIRVGMSAIEAASYVRLADGPNGELRTARRVTSCTGGGGSSFAPADIPYTYDNGTSGDPGGGNVAFNSTTAASITSMRINFTDGDGQSQAGLVSALNASLGSVLMRWDGGSLALRVTEASGSFGSYAQYAVTYLSGTVPADGTDVTLDFALYQQGPRYYRATLVSDGANITVSGEYNQLGGTPAWATDGGGGWTLTLTGAFPDGKTKGLLIQAERNQEIITPAAFRDGSDDAFTISFLDNSTSPIEPIKAWNVFIEVTP